MMIDSELADIAGVRNVTSSLTDHSVIVEGEFGAKTPEEVAQFLSAPLQQHGYALSVERDVTTASWQEFQHALPLALIFILVFLALQKLGIVNLVTTSNIGLGTAFVLGIVASVSTCMAVVGSLVLSLSASFAKEGDRVKPQLLFHVGRIGSFFVLGGVVGALGSVFQLGATGTLILGVLVALVLLVLGINLLDVFPWAKKLQPTLPAWMGKHAYGLKRINHTLTPLLVGMATFILPCGFTQSMQLYALSTGSFWTGAFTMLAFALGTLPMLALLSFGSLGLNNSAQSGVFFKAVGLVVIFFGLVNLASALAGAGIIPPLLNF
jgi:sulfite exporter TauE/SafE